MKTYQIMEVLLSDETSRKTVGRKLPTTLDIFFRENTTRVMSLRQMQVIDKGAWKTVYRSQEEDMVLKLEKMEAGRRPGMQIEMD